MFRTLQFQPTTQNSIAAFRTVQTARVRSSFRMFGLMALALLLSPSFAHAEAGGASSSITGTVADPTGAVVPGATVQIQNPVSRFDRSTTTDDAGKFTFPNVPLNPYHLTVNLAGFAPYAQDVDVRSAVPLVLKITLQISSTAENVTVQGEAGDLVENDPTFHTDVDRGSVRQASFGEHFVAAQFAGDAGFAGSCCRLQRPVSRTGRPRGEFFLARWPAHHRPAEQGFLQPDSARRGAIDAGDRGRAAGRIWRQDQPGHRCHDALRTRFDDAPWRRNRLVRQLRLVEPGRQFLVRRQELGKLHRGQWTRYGPLPRSAGVRGDPRAGQ